MTLKRISAATLLLCLSFLSGPHAARATQSYDSCAGFIDSLPATVSTSGTWCLRRDLATSMSSGAAITIAADDITIDCNDFKIGGLAAGNASQATGVYSGNVRNATIRHCNVRGFYAGISLSGFGHLVDGNRIDNNLFVGISVSGDRSRIKHNAVYETGGYANGTQATGILANIGGFNSADIDGNIVDGVFTDGDTLVIYGIAAYGVGRVVDNRVGGLRLKTGGESYGIVTGSRNLLAGVVARNRVVSTSDDGEIGIYGVTDYSHIDRPNVACRDNTIAGFETGMSDCSNDGGNGQH